MNFHYEQLNEFNELLEMGKFHLRWSLNISNKYEFLFVNIFEYSYSWEIIRYGI